MALFGLGFLVSCEAQKPQSELVGLTYSVQGMERYSGENFSVRRNADTATVTIVIDEGYPSEIVIDDASASVLDDLQQIVTRNKMYGYKGTYKPKAKAMDGDMWSFSLSYADGINISADGQVVRPKGGREALKEISEYFRPYRETASIVAFSYGTKNTSMADSGKSISVLRTPDGSIRILLNAGYRDEKLINNAPDSVLVDFQKIVNRHRAFAYNGHYSSEYEVLDGNSWNLSLTYANGKLITSSGYEACPKELGEALNEIWNMVSALIR